jgi:hypothetical protein
MSSIKILNYEAENRIVVPRGLMKEYKNFQLGCVNSGNFVYQGDSNLK